VLTLCRSRANRFSCRVAWASPAPRLQDAMFKVTSVGCVLAWPWQAADDQVALPKELRTTARPPFSGRLTSADGRGPRCEQVSG
jgi:hypothetical protein